MFPASYLLLSCTVLALLSIDEINRLIQFPSIFKSIDKRIFYNLIALFPFFNILGIINSLKYQSDLIDDEQEYYPPCLCNDGLYTWYRMGQIAKAQRAEALDEKLKAEQEVVISEPRLEAVERPGNVIDINYKEKSKQLAGTESSPEDNKEAIITEQPKPGILSKEPLRVISLSTFKKVSNYAPSTIKLKTDVNPVDDEEKLSGFAKWLRNTGTSKDSSIEEEAEVVSSVIEPGTVESKYQEVAKELIEVPALPDTSKDRDEYSPADSDLSPEEKKKKKKKDKKHNKKDLVNQLVYQSVIDNDLLISEPFADLLYAQGYKLKAVKIYEKLMDKFPEKKINFAAKIDKINKENI